LSHFEALVYSGFLVELNQLEAWAIAIGSTCLEAETAEKTCFEAGPGLGEPRGHALVIFEALCGLRTSGPSCGTSASQIASGTRDSSPPGLSPVPGCARRNGDTCEHAGVHVDNLCIATKDSRRVVDVLVNTHGFKLKGARPMIKFQVAQAQAPSSTTCIERVIMMHELVIKESPNEERRSPLGEGDHPGLNTPELPWVKGAQQHQSRISQRVIYILLLTHVISKRVGDYIHYISAKRVKRYTVCTLPRQHYSCDKIDYTYHELLLTKSRRSPKNLSGSSRG
jgi:hypothetical protein